MVDGELYINLPSVGEVYAYHLVPRPPAAPTGVRVTSGSTRRTTGSLRVTYALGDANGSAITRVNAVCRSSNGGVRVAQAHAGATAVPITVRGATTGKTYTCVVTATNSAGTSANSSASRPVIVGAPGAPTAVQVRRIHAGTLRLRFHAAVPNGNPVRSYTARCTPRNNGATRTASSAHGPLTVRDLTPGAAYTCTVTASNSRGSGPPSARPRTVTA